jgi:hypothetical protein
MNENAPLAHRTGNRPLACCIAIAAAVLFACAPQASAHKIVGRDGKVHACYRVKGKPKGAVRLVHRRARCHRGERKVAWPVTGATGQAGATGPSGGPGADAATLAALNERIDALSTRVEKLEGIVGAVCSQISLVTSLLPIETFSCSIP